MYMSAAQILNLISRMGDAGNLAEYLYNTEDDTLAARIRKARELGYWTADEFGTITLTAKGAELVAA